MEETELEDWRRSFKIAEALKLLFQSGKIEFDWNGHLNSRKTKPTKPQEYQYQFSCDFGPEECVIDDLRVLDIKKVDFDALVEVLKNPGKKWVELGGVRPVDRCKECGQHFKFIFNGETIKVENSCRYPEGHPPFSVDIPVPSGVMVFANQFNIDIVRDGRCDVPSEVEASNAYAEQGVAQMFCGNSCPGVYLQEDGTYFVGNGGQYKFKDGPEVDIPVPGKRVAGVCTDLWAWSMTDLDNAKRLEDRDLDSHYYDQVECKPGIYTVTQYFYTIDYDDYESVQIFSTIKRKLIDEQKKEEES